MKETVSIEKIQEVNRIGKDKYAFLFHLAEQIEKNLKETNFTKVIGLVHSLKAEYRSIGAEEMVKTLHKTEDLFANTEQFLPAIHKVIAQIKDNYNFGLNFLAWEQNARETAGYYLAERILKFQKINLSPEFSDYQMISALSVFFPTIKKIICEHENYIVSTSKKLGKAQPEIFYNDRNHLMEKTYVGEKIYRTLKEAFLHIFSNSLDHGIEAPEERLKKHKKERGKISISSSQTNIDKKGYICLEIKDDGQGVDLNKLDKIVESKFPQAKNDTIPHKVELLLTGNISTKDTVSEISGRGVGLGAVKNALKEIGGDLKIVCFDPELNNKFLHIKFEILVPTDRLFEK